MRRVRVGSLPSIPAAVVTATSFLALAVSAPAHAGLEQTGPEGVDLTGVWMIDRQRSDDPESALESLRQQANERVSGHVSGGVGGIGGFGSLGSPPAAGGQDREAMRERMRQTLTSSERIEIMQLPTSVDLNLADRSVSCTSTAKAQVSLPDGGIADQTCGWDGSEFVIELRGRDGFRRTERYSPGDGETLIVNTTVKGARMPELELKSVYVRHESH